MLWVYGYYKYFTLSVRGSILERDMAQWLEREALQGRCLPCGFESRLVQDFQRNIMFLPSRYWDIVSMLCPWARNLTLKSFTLLRWKWVPGRTEMAMCMISSMRRTSCRTVCSLLSWDATSLLLRATLAQLGGWRIVDLMNENEMVHEWTGPVTRG